MFLLNVGKHGVTSQEAVDLPFVAKAVRISQPTLYTITFFNQIVWAITKKK
jgi:hypothetical protein